VIEFGVKRFLLVLAAIPALAQKPELPKPDESVPVFGTTFVLPSGLKGEIYNIHRTSKRLPNFRKMKPVGAIYTASLNVPPQDFDRGFPGVTRKIEWFAIDFQGRFWIQNPGGYRFVLTSDDGANLYIDDQLLIDNDGLHPPETKEGSVNLEGGIHNMRVSYFQGPRFQVALILKIAGPGEASRIFSTDEFKPPSDPSTWTFPDKRPKH
jgi:hypothetical protein